MATGLPIWILTLLCGAANQLVKLVAAACVERRLPLHVLSESVGLPSLHAAVMTCLTTLLGLRAGWGAAETSLALVVTVIVIHDAVRFKASAQEQRAVLSWLVKHLEEEERFRGPAANLSRVWSHRPFHVASGVLFGLVFALVFAGDG